MKLYRFCFALLFAGLIVGCDEFLSTVPDNRTQLNSQENIAQLLVGAYPDGSYALFTEAMSDNAGDKGVNNPNVGSNSADINSRAFQWQDIVDESSGDTPHNYWLSCYEAIAHANQALDAIAVLGGGEDLNPQRGEALVARAYAHFMLVNLFAKHYNPATAATDLGIPYVAAVETVPLQSRKRNTVQEVYDLIEKDLLEGLPLLKGDYERPKFHFTAEAANAFAARFYLYKGEWEKAIMRADVVLNAANAVDNVRNMAAYPYAGGTYDEQRNTYSSSQEPANLLIATVSTIYARYYYRVRYGMTGDIKDALISDSRNLLQSGRASWLYQTYTYGSEATVHLPKFAEYFYYINVSAGIGFAYGTFVLFSYGELLLDRAEAYAMTNQFELANTAMAVFLSKKSTSSATDGISQKTVETVYPADSSYNPFYSLSSVQRSYVKAIAHMRQRNYLQEGKRWFDIRRYHLPVKHTFSDGGVELLTADDPRRELQIPNVAVVQGLAKNPR